MYDF
jgi:hypothetical protein